MIVSRLWTFPWSSGGGWRVPPAAGSAAPGAGEEVAACCSCTAVAPRLDACCVPITQPRMMPKHMPAMAKTMESDLMERAGTRPTSLRHRGLELSREPLQSEHVEVFADALGEADKQRVADQRVADRDFVEVRQPAEHHEVVEIEIVPGVHAEAERMGRSCGSTNRLTRTPVARTSATTRVMVSRGVSADHPAWLVISPGCTGTSVH